MRRTSIRSSSTSRRALRSYASTARRERPTRSIRESAPPRGLRRSIARMARRSRPSTPRRPRPGSCRGGVPRRAVSRQRKADPRVTPGRRRASTLIVAEPIRLALLASLGLRRIGVHRRDLIESGPPSYPQTSASRGRSRRTPRQRLRRDCSGPAGRTKRQAPWSCSAIGSRPRRCSWRQTRCRWTAALVSRSSTTPQRWPGSRLSADATTGSPIANAAPRRSRSPRPAPAPPSR